MINDLLNQILGAVEMHNKSESAQARICWKQFISLTIQQVRELEHSGGSDENPDFFKSDLANDEKRN